MLKNIYSFIQKGNNKDFFSINELNTFLKENNYKEFVDNGEPITIISKDAFIYVDDPLFFYDLRKYGYTNGNDLTLIEWESTSIIIDDEKPAAYLLERDGLNYKTKELTITVEKSTDGYFKKRIRINGKKVSISTLVKLT